jgi:hypothetical protein
MKKLLITIGLISFLLNTPVSHAERLRLYAFYTPSHQVFLDDWFLPSIQDDFDLILECYDQVCKNGDFMKDGWIETMLHKVDLVIRGIKENWGGIFIHADVDIQFFRPIGDTIMKLMIGKDMVVQKDHPNGLSCAGFFACRGNKKTLALWAEIRRRLSDNDYMRKHKGTNDQFELHNLTIYSNPFNIKWALLPKAFMSGGTLIGKQWNPGDTLQLPEGMYMHHANWTVGVENKIAQLKYVKALVSL